MTGTEALKVLKGQTNNQIVFVVGRNLGKKEYQTAINVIEKELKALEILKPRIHLKDNKIKRAYFTIDENGLPVCKNDFKEIDVVFIEASGFVVKNSEDEKLLKEVLENERFSNC